MPDALPDEIDLAWFMKNRGRVRDAIRETEKANLIVGPEGQLAPAKSGRESVNRLYDLRITVTSAEPLPIDPPVLSLTVDDPDQELDLDWTIPQAYNELFLERSDDGETWTPLLAMPGTQDAYEDADVVPGTEYFYRIRGRVGGAYSAYSNIVSGELVAASLMAWGSNFFGGYGNGTTTSVDEPTAQAATDFVKIAVGYEHSAGVKSDGTLWVTGKNDYGQLGLGDYTARTSWTQVGVGTTWTDVDCGQYYTIARKSDSTLHATGDNAEGQLGVGDFTERTSFTQITGSDWSAEFCCGNFHVVAIKNDSTLHAWGNGEIGQLGQGALDEDDHESPTQMGAATNWTKCAAGENSTFAINDDNELWSTGSNSDGQLGLGDTNYRNELEQVAGSTWANISCGQYHVAATTTAGTIHVAGKNTSGQVGDGGFADRTTFYQVGADTNWEIPACGSESTLALKTNGEVWGWGNNSNGNLGDGTTTNPRLSPVQAAGAFSALFAGYYTTFGIGA